MHVIAAPVHVIAASDCLYWCVAWQNSWSARTQQVYTTLNEAFKESGGMGLSYDAMIAQTRSAPKRRVVAGCFQELLFLTTHGLTDLAQSKPYGTPLPAPSPHANTHTHTTRARDDPSPACFRCVAAWRCCSK